MDDLHDLIKQDFREVNEEIPTNGMKLYNYMDGSFIREATEHETMESYEQAKHDGGSGVIIVEIKGQPLPCYVM